MIFNELFFCHVLRNFSLNIQESKFNSDKNGNYSDGLSKVQLRIDCYSSELIRFTDNKINYKESCFNIQSYETQEIYFENNVILSNHWNYLLFNQIKLIIFINNTIQADLLLDIDKLQSEYDLQWPITTKRIMPLNYVFSNTDALNNYNNQNILNQWHTENQGSDAFYYKNSLTQLSKFYNYFKEFHDRQSANDVYIRIKNLETQRLGYLYEKDASFENLFEVMVNRFLKRFSNYGTSPAKIVISAFQIILFFAFLFLFSNNSWNTINTNALKSKIEPTVGYFISDNDIEKSYAINSLKIEENNTSKLLLLEHKSNIPRVFFFPTLFLLNAQNKVATTKLSLWKYLNVVKGSWGDLSKTKKVTNSIALVAIMLFYVITKILSTLLNALTLSINSFTTLGFGEIPIKGIGRYLAILEGFIGWIFLTLFSVTLISQVLS